MDYRSLGRTGVQVSVPCLGTMMFGGKADQDEATRIVDGFLDAGGNFIDTANVYARGVSEEMTGRALRGGKRDRVVLATKVYGPMGEGPNDRGNSRFHVIRQCEESLRRLGTDHIDLYQLHRPHVGVPIDETLRALDDLIRQGKIRYIGTSTFPAYQVVESLWVSDHSGLNRFICEQPPYHILDRRIEREVIPMAQTYGLGIVAWSPLGGGKLTGKYHRGQPAPGNSRQDPSRFPPAVWDVLEGLEALCDKKGCTMMGLALSWVASRPGVTCPIVGPGSLAQLNENLAALDVPITKEDAEYIDSLVKPGNYVDDYYWAQVGPDAKW